jgi:hypothetical protein
MAARRLNFGGWEGRELTGRSCPQRCTWAEGNQWWWHGPVVDGAGSWVQRAAVNRCGAHGVEGWPVRGQRWVVNGEVLMEEMAGGAVARGGTSVVGLSRGWDYRSTATLGCMRTVAHDT